MENIQERLEFIYKKAVAAEDSFNKKQDKVLRFLFCAIQKLKKTSLALSRLYSDQEYSEDMEFGIGILIRPLVMDMILMMKLKSIYSSYVEVCDEMLEKIENTCYIFILDGTQNIIDNISQSSEPQSEKTKAYQTIFKMFQNSFEYKKDKLLLKKEFSSKYNSLTLTAILNDITDDDENKRNIINDLYCYYSKYEHLSHWTSLTQTNLDFDRRKNKIGLSSVLILLHLKDLLLMSLDFDKNNKMIETHIRDIQIYIQRDVEETKQTK